MSNPINVSDLTKFNVTKAVGALNVTGVKDFDSGDRSKLRSLFNGLGLPSAVVETWGLQEFERYIEDPSALYDFDVTEIDAALTIAHRMRDVAAHNGVTLSASSLEQFKDGIAAAINSLEDRGGDICAPAPVKPEPVTSAPLVEDEDDDEEVARVLREVLSKRNKSQKLNEDAIRNLVMATVDEKLKDLSMPTAFNLTVNAEPVGALPKGHRHYRFTDILDVLADREPCMLVGPAGSGKTTAAQQVAEVLNMDFAAVSGLESEYKLKGFVDGQGRVVDTDFLRIYTEGGVFLFDEMDASDPQAVKTFNSAIENGFCDFPGGVAKVHEDFRVIAGANTYGRGADRMYVGSNQLDASTMDRFVVLDWYYDEAMEIALSTDEDWARQVQGWRKAKDDLRILHVISPRATIKGAKLLARGWDRQKVEDAVVWKGLDADSVSKIKGAA